MFMIFILDPVAKTNLSNMTIIMDHLVHYGQRVGGVISTFACSTYPHGVFMFSLYLRGFTLGA